MREMLVMAVVATAMMTSTALATNDTRQDVVTSCQKEAARGQALAWRMEPSLRTIIEDKRRKMNAACAAFLSGAGGTAELSQCLHQASASRLHIQRDRYLDRAQIERQKEQCRAAAK